MLINIPLSFEFRKTKADWNQSIAQITGWARRVDGTIDGGSLTAQIATGGFSRPVKFPRKRLPEGQYEGLWLIAYTDAEAAEALSAFNPLLLVPSGKTYVEDEELKKNSQPADPWLLRAEFLKLDPTPEAVVAFLNQWGRWNSEEYVELSEITSLQQAIREAMTTSPGKWFESPYSLPSNWRRRSEFPYFALLTDKIEVALRMTVTTDLLDQLDFRACARPDCGQPFKVESNHVRKYCSKSCAHVEAVRRSRKVTSEKQV